MVWLDGNIYFCVLRVEVFVSSTMSRHQPLIHFKDTELRIMFIIMLFSKILWSLIKYSTYAFRSTDRKLCYVLLRTSHQQKLVFNHFIKNKCLLSAMFTSLSQLYFALNPFQRGTKLKKWPVPGSLQRHQTPLTKAVILPLRIWQLLSYHCLDRCVCLLLCIFCASETNALKVILRPFKKYIHRAFRKVQNDSFQKKILWLWMNYLNIFQVRRWSGDALLIYIVVQLKFLINHSVAVD